MNNFKKLKKINPYLYSLYNKAVGIILAKNADYAGKGDFYKNFRRVENLGVDSATGIMIREEDKISRIENYFKNGEYQVKDESLADTVIDTANYFFLMLGVIEDDRKRKKKRKHGKKKVGR